ncbi:MAG: DUF2628 domain-containing protein [Pseudolabrys sp.]
MPTFTVHAPPRRDGEAPASPERFVFVRDGFHGWAFLLAPLWLIARRLWLALVFYVIVTVAVATVLRLLGASFSAQAIAAFCIALLIGFEASTIRRWTLTRRGWATLGFVVGDDQDVAERRFFTQWAAGGARWPEAEPLPSPTVPVRRGAPTGRDVIGLFPEPGQNR